MKDTDIIQYAKDTLSSTPKRMKIPVVELPMFKRVANGEGSDTDLQRIAKMMAPSSREPKGKEVKEQTGKILRPEELHEENVTGTERPAPKELPASTPSFMVAVRESTKEQETNVTFPLTLEVDLAGLTVEQVARFLEVNISKGYLKW